MSQALDYALTRTTAAVSDAERDAILADPGFGKVFTDHMALAMWTVDDGWHDRRVQPYGPLQVMPSAAVLHYGQEIFEGLKAYRHEDGTIWAFRPEANAQRMVRSAHRLALPALPEEDFLASVRALVEADQDWVPAFGTGETSLYLRPFMFASEAFLGVREAHEVTYAVIASPAGAYFPGGIRPVNLWLATDYARAGDGGTGAAKCGGNYASSLAAQLQGYQHDCQQVVFLDSSTHTYIEELGGMNLFFVYRDGRIATPALTGSILEGITRMSVLEIAKEMGLQPQERRIEAREWKEGVASGEITEIFACGTAAVITPVGELRWQDGKVAAPASTETALAIRERLLGIQYGTAPDPHGWMTRLV